MNDPTRLSMLEQLAALQKGELRPIDLVEAYLQRIETHDCKLQALRQVFAEEARQRARELEQDSTKGPLWGLPYVVKDNIVTKLGRTTCGSQILKDFESPYDASVIERLRAADAILLGKSNLDEFAMGSSTENSSFGPTRNPWNVDFVPGGSSGGSAAAVAARFCSFALGSDTGGSIRQPAAFCGVVGMKPTYGYVPRYGLVAFASSLDQIGALTRRTQDAECVLRVIAGHDERDATSIALPAGHPVPVPADLSGFRIGVPRHLLEDGMVPEVQTDFEAARKLAGELGAELVDVELQSLQYAIAIYYIIAAAEASSNLSRYDGVRYTLRAAGAGSLQQMLEESRFVGFGPEVKRRILLGSYVLSEGFYEAYYRKAQRARTRLQQDFEAAWSLCDFLLLPTSPTPPFRFGERSAEPLSMYLSDVFTVPANLARLPAVSIPSSCTSGLPLGVQWYGPPHSDWKLLAGATRMQEALGFPECEAV